MQQSSAGGIFISYRRGDASGMTGRVYDRLKQSFGTTDIFMDVDGLKGGLDFVQQLDANLAQSSVLIAMIGPGWLDARDAAGQRRLDGEHDFVRREIASALQRGIPLLPVLLDGAKMPDEEHLPENIKPLARRHALELRHTRFSSDATTLVDTLAKLLPVRRRAHYGRWIFGVAILAASAAAVVVLKPEALPWWKKELSIAAVDDRAAEEAAKKRGEAWRARVTPESVSFFDEALKYDLGQGVPIDYVKARSLYEKASGHPWAVCNLGVLYENGQGGPADVVKAREFYQRAAEQGVPRCMFYLGNFLRDGKGGPADLVKARASFEKASDAGYAAATHNLGMLWFDGRAGAVDLVRARQLFELAVTRGYGFTFLSLARMLDHGQGGPAEPHSAAVRLMDGARVVGSDGDKARAELVAMTDFSQETRRAVQQELSLAGLYTGTVDGLWGPGSRHAAETYIEKNTTSSTPKPSAVEVPVDDRAAEEAAKKRGEAWRARVTPESEPFYTEALKYDLGQGVPIDYVKARSLYEKAMGDPWAVCNLGLLHEMGQGGPKDDAKARELYQIAADQGVPKCMFYLGNFVRDGRGGPRDVVRAREWFEKASDMGHGSSSYNAGVLWFDGRAGKVDFVRARGLFELALKRGNGLSFLALARMLDRGEGGPAEPRTAAVRLMDGARVVGSDGDSARKELVSMGDLSPATRKAAQQELADLGLYTGTVDGLWSPASRLAAERYIEKNLPAPAPRPPKTEVASVAVASPPTPPPPPKIDPAIDRAAEAEARRLGEAWREKISPEANQLFLDGLNYEYGRNGVVLDLVRARESYAKAEAHGGAICNLGVLQASGRGGPKDDVAARHSYATAANLGVPVCMRNLGSLLRDGRGGAIDLVAAREWFEKSTAFGDATSARDLSRMLRDGKGGPVDGPRARQLTTLAISRGSATAHGDLAFLLDRGIGGPPDPVSAARRLLLPQGLVSGEGDWSREQLKGAMPSFSEETRKAVQQEFTQLGLYSGAIDGLWSATSQYAAELYLEKYVKAEKK